MFGTLVFQLSGTVSAVLGWTPEQFWNATPAELAAIFAAFSENTPGHQNQAPLGITQLEKLKETFPDG
ncbi:MAG: phage tail assembly chaperone [Sphingomonadales bacterium]|nr:phage tail assembly chaperone [Sphingomonadales bacterium]PIX65926.1 MAG: phage tail assembly chaperone [Sphingomonadales bacterium CG_4_10_14_3_um_filter_58_15]NCO49314.1 phage tail assembly chaperone [Sphingomonadales bacterium]NCO99486.1 phage tail assembly chaperone [Sphingomonadales bacterium]NCP27804.1 phage tail assembly chaperone [Sphingomonadales bacterium]